MLKNILSQVYQKLHDIIATLTRSTVFTLHNYLGQQATKLPKRPSKKQRTI